MMIARGKKLETLSLTRDWILELNSTKTGEDVLDVAKTGLAGVDLVGETATLQSTQTRFSPAVRTLDEQMQLNKTSFRT